MWLTNFGLLEKGRMIEIEALYVSLTALAFICWLSWWKRPAAGWPGSVPGIFLGLGLLAKGPLNLFFFYAVVVAVLWQARELRQLLEPAALRRRLFLMLGIFAAWAIPCLQMIAMPAMSRTSGRSNFPDEWRRATSSSATGSSIIPRGIAYLLPWAVLLPFARFALLENEERTQTLPRLVVRHRDPFCRRQPAAGRAAALQHAAARAGDLAARDLHHANMRSSGRSRCAKSSPGRSSRSSRRC